MPSTSQRQLDEPTQSAWSQVQYQEPVQELPSEPSPAPAPAPAMNASPSTMLDGEHVSVSGKDAYAALETLARQHFIAGLSNTATDAPTEMVFPGMSIKRARVPAGDTEGRGHLQDLEEPHHQGS